MEGELFHGLIVSIQHFPFAAPQKNWLLSYKETMKVGQRQWWKLLQKHLVSDGDYFLTALEFMAIILLYLGH